MRLDKWLLHVEWRENGKTKPQYKLAFRGVFIRVLQRNKTNRIFIQGN